MTRDYNVEIDRYLSHGHIGFNLMFVIYSKCLYTVALSKSNNAIKEADKGNKNKDMRFPVVANAWIRNKSIEFSNQDTQEFPITCFWILIHKNRVVSH
jgi:hypothetical protein